MPQIPLRHASVYSVTQLFGSSVKGLAVSFLWCLWGKAFWDQKSVWSIMTRTSSQTCRGPLPPLLGCWDCYWGNTWVQLGEWYYIHELRLLCWGCPFYPGMPRNTNPILIKNLFFVVMQEWFGVHCYKLLYQFALRTEASSLTFPRQTPSSALPCCSVLPPGCACWRCRPERWDLGQCCSLLHLCWPHTQNTEQRWEGGGEGMLLVNSVQGVYWATYRYLNLKLRLSKTT